MYPLGRQFEVVYGSHIGQRFCLGNIIQAIGEHTFQFQVLVSLFIVLFFLIERSKSIIYTALLYFVACYFHQCIGLVHIRDQRIYRLGF